jgi:multidrug efflux pump subunit AcrA (membrane-fusion protein)
MPQPSRNLLAAATAYLPTLLVLALLGVIGWWGATHDWKLGGAEEEDKKPEQKAAAEEGNPLRPVKLASEEAADEAGIKVYPAEQQRVSAYVTANGEVDYDQRRLAQLASRVPGTVWSVEKQAGDAVDEGDVLALVSSVEVGKAKGDFLRSLVDYQLKSKLYERLQAAVTSVSERQVREAEAQMREARIRLFSDQQALLNLGLEVRLPEALQMGDEQAAQHLRGLGLPAVVLGRPTITNRLLAAALWSLPAQGLCPAAAGPAPQLLGAAGAVLTAPARGNQDILTSNLVPITSPFKGVVVRRDLVVGEQVSTRATHFSVADLDWVWVLLNVRLEDIPKIAMGQEMTFQTEGLRDEVPTGRLTWISAEVDDKTHTLAVRAQVRNPNGRLRPHSFGTGRILVDQRMAVTVPPEAVQTDVGPQGPTQLVFVRLSNATFEPRMVEVGLRGDKFIEIKGGLQVGEPVVVGGSHRLKSEMLKERISGED